MAMNDIREGKLLYHLTKLENLGSIIDNDLIPRRYLVENKAGFLDVADPKIISKRTELGLDKYVPFHFHPYSAFDVAVKNASFDELIYICISRDFAIKNKFKILPKHPLSIDDVTLYEYEEGFSKIDWQTMQTSGTNDEYSKNVKMAECITELSIPVNCFQSIYVRNNEVKKVVESILEEKEVKIPPPYVNVQIWLKK